MALVFTTAGSVNALNDRKKSSPLGSENIKAVNKRPSNVANLGPAAVAASNTPTQKWIG